MMQLIFSIQAEKEFLKLDKSVQQIITKKLQKIKQ
jgi:mRNA-degrading endonuclease RelE of RelBE toxin-antitoxin system